MQDERSRPFLTESYADGVPGLQGGIAEGVMTDCPWLLRDNSVAAIMKRAPGSAYII